MRMDNHSIAALFVVSIWIAGCAGSEPPAAAPTAPPAPPTGAATPAAALTPAAPSTAPGATDLTGQLKASKLTLLEGIQKVEKDNGPAISAKFELEEGKLMLSIYTAKAGLEKDAEHNVLLELGGDATAAQWQPKREVFEDKEHITRAATQLTLIRRAKTTLPQVIAKASAKQPGTVYSVTPVARGKKPVFDVQVATPEGKTVELTIDPAQP